jgi:DNA-binding PadR family transcriptional regulator
MFDKDDLFMHDHDEIHEEIHSKFDKEIVKHFHRMFQKKITTLVIHWMISNESTYGYELIKKLNEGWNTPIEDEELEYFSKKKKEPFGSNRVYPILKSLEEKDLIKGTWQMEGKRKIKYYEITEKGKLTLEKFKKVMKSKTSPIFKEFIKEMLF